MFFYLDGEVYRLLEREREGVWAISYDHPRAPFFLDEVHFSKAERVETPEAYIQRMKGDMTQAQRKRYDLIAPLLADDTFVTDPAMRREKIAEIATENHTTVRRIRELYFTYLATGILTRPKERATKEYPEFDWAIKTFYLSSKRHSLRTTYDLMILAKYTNREGVIDEKIPSWSSFRHYYERHWRTMDKQKRIARDGLTSYQRNHRMAYGSAMAWREKLGAFQMDATQADVYIVSEYDRGKVIGRPNIILAVDTATQLIAGVYVGMEASETAVLTCLANVAADKVEYCREFGVEISQEDWSCCGVMAQEIITDRGLEFTGNRIDEFLLRYGVERQSLPPFRPDEKGLVEKTFDLLQSCYKPALRGKGTIGEDVAERWATDYRKQAVLTLHEFTRIVLLCVVYLNRGRIIKTEHLPLDAPCTPSSLWQWYLERGQSNLLPVDAEEVYRMALPRTRVKLTRKGVSFNRLYYAPEREHGFVVGDTVEIAYDVQKTDTVFLVDGIEPMIPCRLTASCKRYQGSNLLDVQTLQAQEHKKKSALEREELEQRVNMHREILNVIVQAEREVYR